MTFFMENLDATIIATALPAMATQFGVMPVDLNVGISAYVLAVAIFIPVGGWLADRFGAQYIFTSAITLFTCASILCGMSESLSTFILARVLQGIAGAMMVPVGRLIVVRCTPKEKLVQAIAYITWPGLVAPILGPPIGGFIVTHFGWKWIFYLNIPLGLLGIYFACKLVENIKFKEVGKFDLVGFALIASACASIMYGFEKVGQDVQQFLPYLWLVALGIGLFAVAVFYMKRAAHPLLRFEIMQYPTFSVSLMGGSVFRIAMSAIPFLLPLLFQEVFHFSAFQAGLCILAVFVGNLAMKPFTTPLMKRFGFKNILVVNGILGAFAIGSCALFTPQTPWVVMLGLMFLSGLSRSMQFTCYNSMSFAEITPQYKRYATTQYSLFFQMSVGVSVAISALMLRSFSQFNHHLQPMLLDFQYTFIAIGLFSLISLKDSLKLSQHAGSAVSGYQVKQ